MPWVRGAGTSGYYNVAATARRNELFRDAESRQDQEGTGISDLLIFGESGKDNQEWDTIADGEKPP